MFKIKTSGDYVWPITVKTADDGGKYAEDIFSVRFKRLKKSEIEALFKDGSTLTDDAVARRVVAGFSDVLDNNGNPIEYSPSNFDELLETPNVAAAIVVAFIESINGARIKN